MLAFHAYINDIHGSIIKISSKNLVRQRCAEGFNSGVKSLNPYTVVLCTEADLTVKMAQDKFLCFALLETILNPPIA
jgi:hypothetical protein